jgi:anti-anti-sigma factor
VPVLRLVGDFDSFETDDVRKGFEDILSAESPSVVVDLGDMTFANSTTLAAFINGQKKAREFGGTLVLAAPKDFILRTLKTLGLHQVFPIADTLDDAVEKINGSR